MKLTNSESGSAHRIGGYVLVASALALTFGTLPVSGVPFSAGQVSGNFDTTISIGVLSRLENPNPIYYGTTNTFNGVAGTAYSVNCDDGDLNFGRGIASTLLKATSDLELKWRNWKAFVRGYYLYDPKVQDTIRPHLPLGDLAKDRVGNTGEVLDNYVAGKFDLGTLPLTIRAGRQVISWGESTFIPNGINVINPVDVARLRAPGAELREALLPVYAVDGSLAVTDKFSVEAVALLEFRRTEVDPAGTLFSTTDVASRGATKVMLGFGSLADNQSLGAIPRGKDRESPNYGQWGVAAHYLATNLNHTDFGFYFLRYGSRLPVLSATTPTTTVQTYLAGSLASLLIQNGAATSTTASTIATQLLTVYATSPSSLTATQQALIAGAQKVALLTAAATGRYFVEYPKDISMMGVSFNTDLGNTGIALQGEISYKRDVPLQIDDVELLYATLSALSSTYGANNQIGNYYGQYGREVSGYRRYDVWQAQATATKVFGPMLGASQFTLVGEIGITQVPNLPSKDVLRFDGSGTYTAGSTSEMVNTGSTLPATPASAFADRTSWGYQFMGKLEYNNVFAGINVAPTLAFAHDVKGNTPLPIGNFIDGRKTLTFGADFTYQNRWALELRYVDYFGAGAYNLLGDRDYVSATLKYSF